MTDDGMRTGPGSSSPDTPPAVDTHDSPDDENFKQSMAELSRRLGERAAGQPAADPAAAAAARRAALQEYEDRSRERRLIGVMGVAVAAAIATGTAYFVSTIGPEPVPLAASATARTEPASSFERTTVAAAPAPSPPSPTAIVSYTPAVETASAQTASAPDSQRVPAPPQSAAPSPPPPTASVASARPATVESTEPAAVTSSPQTAVETAPGEATLRPDDVREAQARLRSFGFNPGPRDGTAGRMTERAVARYQQARGLVQTGEVDRQLLEQLRQDPAPKVAQQVAQRAATRPPETRRADAFGPVRQAGDRLGRWLDSLVR